ncbi:2-amino-4-hydroxy-6-hydroxymethyldihydropteridinediphosphokinase [soil metagenome]
MNKEVAAFISLGSNLGDRWNNINRALELIMGIHTISIHKHSCLYSTSAWGNENQSDFLNMVIEIHTKIKAELLMKELLQIEEQMGRIRIDHWGPRSIDLDIIYFDDQIISSEFLKVPHPEMQNRNFVLVPLVEIAPEFVHPVFNINNSELLNNCQDKLEVIPFINKEIENA